MCGISIRILKLLIANGLLPQAVRAAQGRAYLPADSVPTWQECRRLREEQRDRQPRRAADLLDRLHVASAVVTAHHIP
jgi:hypothetical protein